MNSINLCTDNILSHLKNNEQRYVIQNYQGEILCITPEDCTASINIFSSGTENDLSST